jgi:hypothetical protein
MLQTEISTLIFLQGFVSRKRQAWSRPSASHFAKFHNIYQFALRNCKGWHRVKLLNFVINVIEWFIHLNSLYDYLLLLLLPLQGLCHGLFKTKEIVMPFVFVDVPCPVFQYGNENMFATANFQEVFFLHSYAIFFYILISSIIILFLTLFSYQ